MRVGILGIFLIFLLTQSFGFTVKWRYTGVNNYDRMTFGASAAIADLGADVNSVGGEADNCLEIIIGSDEYSDYFPELGAYAVGIWRCIDALGNLEWAVDTRTDESRSSVAVLDFYTVSDGHKEIVGGTTSGWNVEAMDRFGNFLWTFPAPPITAGPYMWHSSPAVADIIPSTAGLEIVIGNNPCHSVWCFQADPSDGTDDGISFDVSSASDCYYGYGTGGGTDGIDWDVLWYFDTEAPVISTPAVGDIDGDGDMDVVVGDGFKRTYTSVVAPGGNIYCIDGPTGALRWRISTGGTDPIVDASPALADFDDDGDLEIIVGAGDGLLYFIDGDEDASGTISASEMTTLALGGPVHASAAIADVNGDGQYEIIAASDAGIVMCVSYTPPTTFSVLWSVSLDTAIIASPAIANKYDPRSWTHFCANPMRNNFYPTRDTVLDIFIADMAGKVYRLNPISGTVEDQIRLDNHIHTSPVIADIDLDCELELVVTGCTNPFGGAPDTIFCLGTGLFNPDCMECGYVIAWGECPVDTVLPIVSCPMQAAVFEYAETTYWDHPDTEYTFSTVNIYHNDGSEVHFALQGIAATMNFVMLPMDTVEVNVWHNWLHGDSVIITLDSIITFGGCTTYVAESISFLVDLQPPVVEPAPGMPANGGAVPTGNFNIEYIATDEPAGVFPGVSFLSIRIYHNDGSKDSTFVPGSLSAVVALLDNDSVVVSVNVCDSIYDYGCSCGPNCTTYTFWYLAEGYGPVAQPIVPLPGVISACDPQGIWIAITDSQGIDSTTIVAVFNNDTFYCTDAELSFTNDTLYFNPPSGYWSDDETVYVQLIAADDMYGNALQSPVSWQFYIDYSAPLAQMTSPPESSLTYDRKQPVSLHISDNLAGLWVDSSTVSFGNYDFQLSEVLEHITADSLAADLFFNPADWGIVWFPGETVDVVANLCDHPDTCGPNCEQYSWWFFLPADMGCSRVPNPFTPNEDGVNDYCQFTCPGIGYEDVTISIFDLHSVLVRVIDVPSGEGAKEKARWNGNDKSGNPVPQGLYLYIIEADGEIVCEGTVTVAR